MNEILMNTHAAVRPADHPAVASGRIGVLIVNLGTPDATDYWSMRRYLKEFLSDARVIEENRLKWWLILNLVILTIRPGRKGKDYDKIWNRERDESPLKTITRAQSEKLGQMLAAVDGRVTVDWAMRYGNPSIKSRLEALQVLGCDKAFDVLKTMRWQPAVRIAPPWHDDPVYIEALAVALEQELNKLTFKPEMILASFHGVPKEYLVKGDPYYCQCHKTARLLGTRLGLDESRFMLTFQSRFGFAEWLQPYTDMTVKALAARGVKNLAIVMPGFTADCLETLEEIAGENAEYFHHAGGENFAAIPCLNDSEAGMTVISHVVLRELKGWV
jgi:ferrochelatase